MPRNYAQLLKQRLPVEASTCAFSAALGPHRSLPTVTSTTPQAASWSSFSTRALPSLISGLTVRAYCHSLPNCLAHVGSPAWHAIFPTPRHPTHGGLTISLRQRRRRSAAAALGTATLCFGLVTSTCAWAQITLVAVCLPTPVREQPPACATSAVPCARSVCCQCTAVLLTSQRCTRVSTSFQASQAGLRLITSSLPLPSLRRCFGLSPPLAGAVMNSVPIARISLS